ncbi:hypothetical protein [Spirosoma validum]|uniref:Collagen-like protein n=1 Tax=Spirosoma validum TaxID=2771355 RepID=A0A927GFC7_9BACT|nr:hypothetical protein [Spirosoma validum]MBD2755558.1 hypothetical protein [Spirosoma validum]
MKTRFAYFGQPGLGLMALLLMLVISCKGPEGPQGPVGPAGATGAVGATGAAGTTGPAGVSGVAGATGAQGAAGNPNVVYSDWKPVDVSGTFFLFTDGTVYLGNDNKTDNAYLTQEAIDKGLIYIYYKLGQKTFDAATGETKLVERVVADSGFGYVKIPGRTTSKDEDFTSYYVANQLFGVNFLRISTNLMTTRSNVAIPELTGKSAQFYRDMVKTLPQYRIVVAYGSTKGGRSGAVDFKNYASVKQAYNLQD